MIGLNLRDEALMLSVKVLMREMHECIKPTQLITRHITHPGEHHNSDRISTQLCIEYMNSSPTIESCYQKLKNNDGSEKVIIDANKIFPCPHQISNNGIHDVGKDIQGGVDIGTASDRPLDYNVADDDIAQLTNVNGRQVNGHPIIKVCVGAGRSGRGGSHRQLPSGVP